MLMPVAFAHLGLDVPRGHETRRGHDTPREQDDDLFDGDN